MSETSNLQLSPEVIALQNLIASARQKSPELWNSVASAINATDAAVINITTREPPVTQVISGCETTESISKEDYNG
jgi:hypothetical protein